jgi:hypothetical protein
MHFLKRTICLPFACAALIYAQALTPLQLDVDRLAAQNPAATDEAAKAVIDDMIADITAGAINVKLLEESTEAAVDRMSTSGRLTVGKLLAFRRADVQSGSSSSSSGSTSAILSPLLPAIFGIGIETGGLTRTVSGTTISLRANPAGLFCASGQQAAAVAVRDEDSCKTFWKRVGLTASFDTSRGEKKQEIADLDALNNQFAEFTARVELVNRRKLSGAKFAGVFKKEIEDWRVEAQKLANLSAAAAAGEYETALRSEVGRRLNSLLKTQQYAGAIAADRKKLIEVEVRAALKSVPGEPLVVETRRDVWLRALEKDSRLQTAVLNAFTWMAEYSYQKPDLAKQAIGTVVPKDVRPPSLHSLRMIFAKGVPDRRLDLTGNLSASFFGDVRPGMRGNFRDFRAGGEAKFGLRTIANYGVPSLSFAGLYSFLNQQALGLGIIAFNAAEIKERGHIGLFQAKLEFPTANNAIRFPFSFTYSNRTELIKESEVRGQVGVSFNLDALFAAK